MSNWPAFDHIPGIRVVMGGGPSLEQIAQPRGFPSRWPRRTARHHKCAGWAGDGKILRIPDCRIQAPDYSASPARAPEPRRILSTPRQAAGARDAEARCRQRDLLDRKMDRPKCQFLARILLTNGGDR
jgi:hypothetical protein